MLLMSNIGLSEEDKKQVFENELLTGFQFKSLTENKIFQKNALIVCTCHIKIKFILLKNVFKLIQYFILFDF